MSSETTTCPGCDNSFTLRGYQSHLALSRDPLCRAVFDKLKKANDAYEYLTTAQENAAIAGADAEAVLFQGDAFGTADDYASDTFGQDIDVNNVDMQDADADNPPPLMEVSDDEDSEDELDDDDEEITSWRKVGSHFERELLVKNLKRRMVSETPAILNLRMKKTTTAATHHAAPIDLLSEMDMV